jgi:hypothetical protein
VELQKAISVCAEVCVCNAGGAFGVKEGAALRFDVGTAQHA